MDITLQALARAVPIYIHRGRRYFVRIGEIPDPLRSQFMQALRGSACPLLDGEGPLAFAWDWEAWIEGRWIGRAVQFNGGDRTCIAELPEFDALRYLDSPESITAYLADIIEANDADLLEAALNTISRLVPRAAVAPIPLDLTTKAGRERVLEAAKRVIATHADVLAALASR